jgi:nitroreductase
MKNKEKIESTATIISELIFKRYSPVMFSEKEVSDDALFKLFEAARWAPSSFNDQPWNFIYGRKNKDEVYDKLFEALMDANQEWAKNAPVLALSIANMISPTTNKENRYAFHDTGMAMGNLLMQATSMDIYVHQMGGFSNKKAREFLNIPRTHEPVAMMAIGYRGQKDKFPENLRKREEKERDRRELKDFVFNKEF